MRILKMTIEFIENGMPTQIEVAADGSGNCDSSVSIYCASAVKLRAIAKALEVIAKENNQ